MATKQTTKTSRLFKILPYILIVGGTISLICAFIIMLDKLTLLSNPSFRPSCDLNPILSCGSVMSSKQGSVAGFPNPIFGLAGFPILITIGMCQLAGATFKRWFWQALNVGLLLSVVFCLWLFVQSVYFIHSLCIYCMIVWVMTITTFWYVSLYNIEAGNVTILNRFGGTVSFTRRHHLDILIGWLLIIMALILQHFWYYYGKFL